MRSGRFDGRIRESPDRWEAGPRSVPGRSRTAAWCSAGQSEAEAITAADPGSQPWLARAVAGRYRTPPDPDFLGLMGRHAGFVFVARRELLLWDRIRPRLEETLGEDISQLYRASRHVSAQLQARTRAGNE